MKQVSMTKRDKDRIMNGTLKELYIKALIDRGNVLHRTGKSLQAVSDYDCAEKIADKSGKRELVAEIKYLKGNAYESMGMLDALKKNTDIAMKIFSALKDEIGYSTALSNMAAYYGFNGNNAREISMLNESVDILNRIYTDKKHQKKTKKRAGISLSSIYNNLGYSHRKMGNNSKAMEFYMKSLKVKKEIDDKAGEANTLNNIGMLYGREGDVDSAISYFEQALKILVYIGDKRIYASVLNNIGYGFKLKRNENKSLECFLEALKVQKQIKDKNSEIYTLCNIGDYYNEKKRYKNALMYFEEAIQIMHETGIKESLHILLTDAAKIYIKINQLQKAASALSEAYKLSVKCRDSKCTAVILELKKQMKAKRV